MENIAWHITQVIAKLFDVIGACSISRTVETSNDVVGYMVLLGVSMFFIWGLILIFQKIEH